MWSEEQANQTLWLLLDGAVIKKELKYKPLAHCNMESKNMEENSAPGGVASITTNSEHECGYVTLRKLRKISGLRTADFSRSTVCTLYKVYQLIANSLNGKAVSTNFSPYMVLCYVGNMTLGTKDTWKTATTTSKGGACLSKTHVHRSLVCVKSIIAFFMLYTYLTVVSGKCHATFKSL